MFNLRDICGGIAGIILLPSCIYIVKNFLSRETPPVKGIYYEPGRWYWVKYWSMYLTMKVRNLKNRNKFSEDDAGYGVKSRESVAEMEKAQNLPNNHLKAVDAVYFNGADGSGNYFVAATARRQNNIVQTILYIRIPDVGLLQLPSLPDTSLQGTEDGCFAAGGLRINPIEPMKTWQLEFSGKLRLLAGNGDESLVDVKFDLEWNCFHATYFDVDTDMHTAVVCDAIAREKWSHNFFENLKKAHQTHYEQFGELTGDINISGVGNRSLKVQGVRDHSYGNVRDWKDIRRYGIQYLHLENGSSLCIGTICFPITFSRLVMGFLVQPDGRFISVSESDFDLYKIGENGQPPAAFQINFVAGGKKYNLECVEELAPVFYIGDKKDARIHERFCRFNVNGVRGWGISEWAYRNIDEYAIEGN